MAGGKRAGWGPATYAPCASHKLSERCLQQLRVCLNGECFAWSKEDHSECAVINAGDATGTSFAACLRVLAGMVGTPAMPNLNGSILFIEESTSALTRSIAICGNSATVAA